MKPFNLKEYLKPHPQKVVTRDGREVMIICTDSTMGDYHIDDESIATIEWED